MAEKRKTVVVQYSNEKFDMPLMHRHYMHELYYLLGGEINYYVADKVYTVPPGSFVFVPPGVMHRTQNMGENRERILINFDGRILPHGLDAMMAEYSKENMISVSRTKQPIIEDILVKIENEYTLKHKNHKELLEAYVTELLILMNRYKGSVIKKIENVDEIVVKIAEYINDHFTEKLSLKSLSSEFGISEAYLSRRFKGITGMGINNYIQYVRIEHAKELLQNTSMSVMSVSEKCGFEDSNYFSVVFKRIMGCSPNSYTKDMRKQNED